MLNRRRFLHAIPLAGLGHALGSKAQTASPATADAVTSQSVEDASKLAGLSYTETQRELMLDGVAANLERYKQLRALNIPWNVAPAYYFDPVPPGMKIEFEHEQRPLVVSKQKAITAPINLEDAAFYPVTQLSELIRRRLVSSTDLTRMYIKRLKKYDPQLKCVITLTEELAMKQAQRADDEISRGRYRGPLHGIPWGAKDLLAVKEYRTTWGAAPYKDQVIPEDATVVKKLEEAGAVLVAKLSMGETARTETWFGGTTKNPWNLEEGAQGSSAGPACATAAGLVGFSIGSDTRGSIVLPADRCGASGLRPTFGTVSRQGAMVLAWTMDKLGPICRSAEDCVLVLDAIRGADNLDRSVRSVPPMNWNGNTVLDGLRIGYLKSAFEANKRSKENDEHSLDVLRSLGVKLIPIELPEFPGEALRLIMDSETAASFDDLVTSGRADMLAGQRKNDRPNNLRHGELIFAAEYIQANRARVLLMQQFAAVMEQIDVFAVPSLSSVVLALTNVTGHPCVVVPNGFTAQKTPTSISFLGGLYKDAQTALVAHRYQQATNFHRQYPPLFI